MSASTVTVTPPPCMVCGKESTLRVDAAGYSAWISGTLIQQAFPEMSDPEREHLKTGTHPACWDEMFGDLIDEEEEGYAT